MKKFKDLIFEDHPNFQDGKRAIIGFNNGYSVSVLRGSMFYSDGIDTYELAILKDGSICYDTPITDDVLGYLTEKEVSEIMIKTQALGKEANDE